VTGLAIIVIGLLVWAGQGLEALPTEILQVPLLPPAVYTAVGALLAARVPGNPVGWLFLVAGLALTPVLPVELLVAAAYEAFRPAPASTVMLTWLVSSFSTPIFIGSLALAGLLFPDGRPLSRRWRHVGVMTVIASLSLGLVAGLDPAGLVWYPTIGNPFRVDAALGPLLAIVRAGSLAALVVALIGVVYVQATRYRRGDAVARAQLRLVISAATLMVVAGVPFLVARYVGAPNGAVMDMLVIVNQISVVSLPLAAAFAITRYHLFGIDVLIGRTIVYVPLMGALGGLYALAVTVFQRIFVAVTGETSDAALLIAVFLIAATFTPLRKALDGLAERWAGSQPRPVAADTDPSIESDELQRTAARVIALGRLEERLAAGRVASGPSTGRRLDIDTEGRVACPHAAPLSFTACLGCQHLVAMTTSPPTIVCDAITAPGGGRPGIGP
jgi:hypothetical protein